MEAELEHKKASKRIKKIQVMVAEAIRETCDTTTLMLFSGNDHLDYKPGHFCTIDPHQFGGLEPWAAYLEHLKSKKEKPRAYSLASSPHEKHLAVTIKEERYIPGKTKYPPLLSPILVRRIPVGTRMEITGFTGPYYLPDDIESRTDHIVHICAGSGVVPNWSIIKYALHKKLKVRHTLIYGNRKWDDVIYRHALDDLRDRYPDKLKIVHALSREPGALHPGAHVYEGRVGAELISKHIEDPTAVEVFACGPALSKWDKLQAKREGIEPTPRFMESVVGAFKTVGVPKERLHLESY
ncbi:MAG: oxidoreductase [Myxococcales bacterium]|nr:oxidoreductase [Myxococcales bacterium]